MAISGNTSRFYMHIHNLHQQRYIQFVEATFPDGPRHAESWTSTITITWSASGAGMGAVFTEVRQSKQAARDAASLRALMALGVDVNQLA